MKPIHIAALALVGALFPAPAGAQATDEMKERALRQEEDQESSPYEKLATALSDFKTAKRVVAQVTIGEQPPEAEPEPVAGPNGNRIVMVQQVKIGGAGDREPYRGGVHVWREGKDEAVIVSEKALPGFGLYVTKQGTIRRETTRDRGFGTKTLEREILSLLDGERLFKHGLIAALEPKHDENTGATEWTGEIDKELLRSVEAPGDAAMAEFVARTRPRVLKTKIRITVSKDGKITAMRLWVTRNDPGREMLARQGGFRVVLGGRGQPVPEKNAGKQADDKPIEGMTTVYAVRLQGGEPNERLKAFRREIKGVLERTKGD